MENDTKDINGQSNDWIDSNQSSKEDQNTKNDPSSQDAPQLGKMTINRPNQDDPLLANDPSIIPNMGDQGKSIVMRESNPSETTRRQDLPIIPNPTNESEQTWFREGDIDDLQSRWKSIQSQFVDEPCAAVEQGEALVAETLERVKQIISDQQQSISQQWLNHDDISTEELRITLLNYRTMLNRMLKL